MATQTTNCWFCGKRPETHTYFVKMRKKVWVDAVRFTVTEKTIPIPRCDQCRSTKQRLMILFWLAVGIPGIAFISLLQWPGTVSLVFLIVGGLISLILFIMAFFTILGNSSKMPGHHPDVKAAVMEGYEILVAAN